MVGGKERNGGSQLTLGEYYQQFESLWRRRLSGEVGLSDPERFAWSINDLTRGLSAVDQKSLDELDEKGKSKLAVIVEELLEDPEYAGHPLAQARRAGRSHLRHKRSRHLGRGTRPDVAGRIVRLVRQPPKQE